MRDLLDRFFGRTEIYLAVVILIVGAVLSFASPYFFTISNFIDLIETYSVPAILAMGLFVVLVSGGIDISFAATASVAQYTTALVGTELGWPAFVCIPFGLAVGILLGALNAILIHYLRIASIIITIATMSVYFGLLMYFSHGESIYTLPDWLATQVVFYRAELASGDTIRITLPIVVMIGAVVLTFVLMTYLGAGRQLYAMGGNPEAARRLGLNIAGIQILAYGDLGFMAAVAGLIQAHRVGESVPNALVGHELNVLAAAVLGGASLSGGIGSVPGVVLGVILLAMLQNGLNLLGVSSYFFQVVIGLAILLSTSITGLSSRARRRRRHVAGAAERVAHA
jgi:simple sugar transport system permease protein